MLMDQTDGTLQTIDGKPVLRFERWLNHPPEKVWTAITDPAEMANWFPARVEFPAGSEPGVPAPGPGPGTPLRFSFGDAGIDLGGRYRDGEVLEFDRPKVYAFRWFDSVLRFELVPEAAGCRLVFTHAFSAAGTWGDRPAAVRNAVGWDACLDTLTARLDGGEPPASDELWFLRRAEGYAEKFGLGEGAVADRPGGYLVRFERDLVQPAEVVWGVLTGGSGAVPGSPPPERFTHRYTPAGPVTAAEAPRLLEYDWLDDGEAAGRVRFELRHQEPIGTRLVVTETIPQRLAGTRAVALAAWQVHLELLFAALHGDERMLRSERTEELAKRYAARLAAGPRSAS
jgi:uncharacterized protein YndB with AHSA1/START domain